jgi:hypothetical protein
MDIRIECNASVNELGEAKLLGYRVEAISDSFKSTSKFIVLGGTIKVIQDWQEIN